MSREAAVAHELADAYGKALGRESCERGVAADHLRGERGEGRHAEEDARLPRSGPRGWEGRLPPEGGRTPPRHAGDGVTTAAQAPGAATARPTAAPRGETAHYRRALAFRHPWGPWTRGRAPGDPRRCMGCPRRLEREVGHGDDKA